MNVFVRRDLQDFQHEPKQHLTEKELTVKRAASTIKAILFIL
jgi:hypothetical protein